MYFKWAFLAPLVNTGGCHTPTPPITYGPVYIANFRRDSAIKVLLDSALDRLGSVQFHDVINYM